MSRHDVDEEGEERTALSSIAVWGGARALIADADEFDPATSTAPSRKFCASTTSTQDNIRTHNFHVHHNQVQVGLAQLQKERASFQALLQAPSPPLPTTTTAPAPTTTSGSVRQQVLLSLSSPPPTQLRSGRRFISSDEWRGANTAGFSISPLSSSHERTEEKATEADYDDDGDVVADAASISPIAAAMDRAGDAWSPPDGWSPSLDGTSVRRRTSPERRRLLYSPSQPRTEELVEPPPPHIASTTPSRAPRGRGSSCTAPHVEEAHHHHPRRTPSRSPSQPAITTPLLQDVLASSLPIPPPLPTRHMASSAGQPSSHALAAYRARFIRRTPSLESCNPPPLHHVRGSSLPLPPSPSRVVRAPPQTAPSSSSSPYTSRVTPARVIRWDLQRSRNVMISDCGRIARGDAIAAIQKLTTEYAPTSMRYAVVPMYVLGEHGCCEGTLLYQVQLHRAPLGYLRDGNDEDVRFAVGVASEHFDATGQRGGAAFLFCSDGTITADVAEVFDEVVRATPRRSSRRVPYGRTFGDGSILTVHLDVELGELSFYVDGIFCGVGFTFARAAHPASLHPIVVLLEEGSSATSLPPIEFASM